MSTGEPERPLRLYITMRYRIWQPPPHEEPPAASELPAMRISSGSCDVSACFFSAGCISNLPTPIYPPNAVMRSCAAQQCLTTCIPIVRRSHSFQEGRQRTAESIALSDPWSRCTIWLFWRIDAVCNAASWTRPSWFDIDPWHDLTVLAADCGIISEPNQTWPKCLCDPPAFLVHLAAKHNQVVLGSFRGQGWTANIHK